MREEIKDWRKDINVDIEFNLAEEEPINLDDPHNVPDTYRTTDECDGCGKSGAYGLHDRGEWVLSLCGPCRWGRCKHFLTPDTMAAYLLVDYLDNWVIPIDRKDMLATLIVH